MRVRPIAVSLVLFGMAAIAGCQGRTEPQPPAFTGTAEPRGLYLRFSPTIKIDAVRGVDEAYLGWLRWSDDMNEESARLPLVVWTDVGEGSFSSEGVAPRYEGDVGKFDLAIGRNPVVLVNCRTADGKAGTVDVNGEKFDLSNGWLILVKTRGGPIRMKQIRREPVRLTPDQGSARQLFESLSRDPEVVAFFGQGK